MDDGFYLTGKALREYTASIAALVVVAAGYFIGVRGKE